MTLPLAGGLTVQVKANCGALPMLVTSLAVAEVDPPPETVAILVRLDGALEATLTVTVMDG